MPLRPQTTIEPDAFIHLPPSLPNAELPHVIYFITGNPGLISYYHEFLSLLCKPQPAADGNPTYNNTSPPSPIPTRCVVVGFPLGGFELSSPSATATTQPGTDHESQWTSLLYPPACPRKQIYGLRDQIELCYARLTATCERVRSEYAPSTRRGSEDGSALDGAGRDPVNIVLVGHSVGAYIALEVVRMHHSNALRRAGHPLRRARGDPVASSSWHGAGFAVTTALLLTPTILDISLSPSGRLATPLLSTVPFLPALAQFGSSALTGFVSASRLEWLVSRITGMADGSHALKATVAFLGSGGAVKQALYLAREEMREIGENRWGEEVWGALKADVQDNTERDRLDNWSAPKLYFWFAKEDHWVAHITRDEIVRIVQRRDGMVAKDTNNAPVILIDEDEGLVHAWCIAQSELAAKRVRGWLEDAIQSHER